jgi:hypothetical protein
MESKADAHLSLNAFIQNHRVMENLVVDNDPTMAYKAWRKQSANFGLTKRRQNHIHLGKTGPNWMYER